MTILVTGATGNVGSQVVRALRERGAPVRAFVRDAAAARLGEGVELAVGDFEDPASLRRALQGAERVFLSSADGPRKAEHEAAVVDACAEAGVGLVVKASTFAADPGSPLPPFAWNGRSEAHLRRSGVPWSILASSFYMTNLLTAADPVRAAGTLPAPAGDGAIGMIDPADVGAAAAVILTSEGHEGRSYRLTGPAAITYREIAATLSAVLGTPVAYVDAPEDALRQGLADGGAPDWLVAHLTGVFARIRAGDFAEVTDTVEELTGRPACTFEAFARDHAEAFGLRAVRLA